MLRSPGADKIGEFSMTDKRLSKITKFMAETMYDENVGGAYGNIHIALGKAFHSCYRGDSARLSRAGWRRLGFNDSVVHQDMVSTRPVTVTAHFKNGRTTVIYKNGQFLLG